MRLAATAALLLALSPAFAAPPATLRVDIQHGGDARTEHFALERVLVGFGQSVWSWVASKFAPKSAEPPGAVSMVVGLIGSMIALAAGFFLPGGFMSLMMSVVFGAGAYMLSRRDQPPGGTAALLLVCAGSALLVVLDLFMPGLALAHDGGLPENQGSIVIWWSSDGSKWLLWHAAAGGIASGGCANSNR